MIEFVVGRRADMRDTLYDQLLQYRHEIFVRWLGWDLPGHAPTLAREEDEFDTSHTVYLAATRDGHVCGCARLLPTTRAYLLEHVFPDLLGGRPLPRAPGVWELSRFAAGSTRSATRSADGNLARAIFQLALFTGYVLGADSLIGVASARVERFCARNGFRILPLGARRPCADAEVGAFAIRVTRACKAETCAVLGRAPSALALSAGGEGGVSVFKGGAKMHTRAALRMAMRLIAAGLGLVGSMASAAHAQNTSWHGLTVRRFNGSPIPVSMTTAQADSCLTAATNLLLTDSDWGTDDNSCNANLYRSGSVGTFTSGDGNIGTASEWEQIAYYTAGFVKVVNTLTWCNGVIGSFSGCTGVAQLNHIVLSEGGVNNAACGKIWAHEFGHAVGLGHQSYGSNVMRTGDSTTLTHVWAWQCDYFRSDYVDYDGPSFARVAAPAGDGLAQTSPVPIERVVAQGLGDRVPAQLERVYGAHDAATLRTMLASSPEQGQRAAIFQLLGLISDGRDSDAQLLAAFANSESRDLDATASAVISLGYLVNRGSKAALGHLIEKARNVSSLQADWAVGALGVSGDPEALRELEELRQDADPRGTARPRYGRSEELLDQAIEANKIVFEKGLVGYYDR